jgi:hypothetical protein
MFLVIKFSRGKIKKEGKIKRHEEYLIACSWIVFFSVDSVYCSLNEGIHKLNLKMEVCSAFLDIRKWKKSL